MLKGYMNCLCEDGNVRHYLLTGLDSSSSLQLLVESHLYDDNEYIAFPSGLEEKGVNPADVDVKEARRVDIGLSSVKVETCRVDVEVPKPKTINCPVNTEIFVRLGALIRYSKSKCFGANNVEYTGLKVSSDEYTPNLYQTYNIPIDNQPVGGTVCLQSFIDREDSSFLGTITLLMGEINKLSLVSPYIEIKLEEDGMNPQFPVLRAFTTSVNKGFRQDEDYLGFKVEYAKASTNLDQGSAWGYYTKVEDIVAAHPEKNFSWLLDRNYNIVSDENLDEIITKIWNHKGIVSYDTETTGLNINFKSRIGQADQAVGIVISIEEGTSYYFPLQHKAIKNLCGGDHKYFMERYMKPILENKDLLAHNGPFDWKVAHIYGINAHIVEDTLGLLKLTIGAEKFDFWVGLKEATAVLLHRDSLELSDLLVDNSWGESDVKFWDLPYELVRLYACADTDNTLALWHYAKKADLLHKYNATRVYNIEMAFGLAVAYQEFYGHCINVEQVEQLKVDTDKGMEESFKKLIDIVGHDFNPNSSQQLMQIMYDELGYPEQINRKNNRRTSDAKALKNLAGITDIEGKPKYPLANALLEYRGYEQIRKTFIKNLDTLATEDGYIFSEVKQYGTTTGRVSIANPNYQSYNDTVKKNIVPRPGYYMTDSDYSSVEYRVLCSMAGQEEIKEAFKDPELDYHAYQAARMFQIPYEAVTKKLRKSAKGINFGLPYGMGDESLGVAIFGEESPENTREAKRLRELYFVGQEKIRDFFEEKRNFGVKNGFTETKYGRRRYYNRAKFSEAKIRRQAGNQTIQGTAADIYKIATGRLFQKICEKGWLGKVLMPAFVHDEVLCEVHESIDPMVWLKTLRECFEVKIEGFCPLYVGFGYGMNWYTAKSTEIPTKLQWELEDKYGDTGYPKWNDMTSKEFCDSISDMIMEFELREVKESIVAPEHQGSVIKPAINTYLHDVLGDKCPLYNKAIESLLDTDYIEGTPLPQSLVDLGFKGMYIKDGKITKVSNSKDLQEALDMFCAMYGIDRSTVNQLSSSDVVKKDEGTQKSKGYIQEDFNEEYDDYMQSEQRLANMILAKLTETGVYVDNAKMHLYISQAPDQYLQVIQNLCITQPNGSCYRLYLVKNGTDGRPNLDDVIDTNCYFPTYNFATLMQCYRQLINTKKLSGVV